MKKTLLLAAAALFAASNVWALDMYVIGANVDGKSWELGTNKMTQTGEGTYEWSGNVLETKFKLNDGTWGAAYNIGQGDAGDITLGTPYKYYMGDGSGDINIAGADVVNNPKIVLDMKAGTIVLTGTPGEKEPVDPSDVTFYMIGSNVNGQSWALAQEDAKFENLGNGIYEWKGKELGSGFKINDGTWSNPQFNFGSSGASLYLDEPFYLWADSNSQNIAFADVTTVENPVVTLDINDNCITVVGEGSGEFSWYIAGINSIFELTEEWKLYPVEGKDGVFSRNVYVVETAGAFKISQDGWSNEIGTNLPEENFIDPDHMTATLEDVSGEGGNVPYELEEGEYTVTFDYNEYRVTFAVAGEDGVEKVVLTIGGKAEYYNLHGQKVANPDKGIYIKVVDGKALKVVK